MKSFLEQWQDIIKKIDEKPTTKPKARYEESQPEPPYIPFNVHKRSLPAGTDKIVLLNLSRKNAEWWVENRLKAKIIKGSGEEIDPIIYYDIVPADASPDEHSIYFNPGPTTKE